jgi:hypothetical protein
MKPTFLEYIDHLHPMACRLLAVKDGVPMSTEDLAKASGLHPSTIKALARANSWGKFRISTLIAYASACGVDLMHQKRCRERLKRMLTSKRGPKHLAAGNRRYWQSILTGEKQWRNIRK